MTNIIDKIRKKVSSNGHPAKYFQYAIGEILLIVLGILIALKINNWNIIQLNSEDEKTIYQGISRQILKDQVELIKVFELNQTHQRQFELAKNLINDQNRGAIDSLAYFAMNLSQFSDFRRSSHIYETLVNSGDLKLIRNKNIPSLLQELEMIYNHINKLEEIHWDIILNELSPEMRGVINYANLKVIKPERLYSVEVLNIFVESIYLTEGKSFVYQQALDQIHKILNELASEIDIKITSLSSHEIPDDGDRIN